MEQKTFKSRLFNRKIEIDNPDYWTILYSEILHRLRQLDDLNCFCHHCLDEVKKLNKIIDDMIQEKHIEDNPKPRNFAGQGYCQKIMRENSERAATIYKK